MTVEELRERLADAADTLRRLPKPKGLERILQSPWPDTLREWLSYGYDRTQVRRAAPTPQAIDRLDEVLEWLGPKPSDAGPADGAVGQGGRAHAVEADRVPRPAAPPRPAPQNQTTPKHQSGCGSQDSEPAQRYTGPDADRVPWGRLVMRDEGSPNGSGSIWRTEHGIVASVRVPRKMLAPYARSLLDAAMRSL